MKEYYKMEHSGVWIKDRSILTFELKEAPRTSLIKFGLYVPKLSNSLPIKNIGCINDKFQLLNLKDNE